MTTAKKNATFDFVVVSNRLPVDQVTNPDGSTEWRTSPGGLVTAMEPVMAQNEGAWVGWPGVADLELGPFDSNGMHLVPVELSDSELKQYYEGFSNDTLWPLYHDVIAQPTYHREWFDEYRIVNERFAEATAAIAAKGATVWVQDYQLQLLPKMLRTMRPDLTIGFFLHIPFPPSGIFAQLPWRKSVLRGMLGADVIGFQRPSDAANFQTAVRRLLGHSSSKGVVSMKAGTDEVGRPTEAREVIARAYPISIDADFFSELARDPEIVERAAEIRRELGDPKTVFLGVDRLDYTKGIRHRIKAYGELVAEGRISVEDAILVQVASPSRERVETYQMLRDEIELAVGRINGDYSTFGHPAIEYLHRSYPRREMLALYLASDVMLVTALRDGMNLVAKEYVAARNDGTGVLVLSEFTGTADEFTSAVQVNPHDIEDLKDAIEYAAKMSPDEQKRRMRSMRKKLSANDVRAWSEGFLSDLREAKAASNEGRPLGGGTESKKSAKGAKA